MSDYIYFPTSVTMLFTTYQNRDHAVKKGLVWMKICNDMLQGVYENMIFIQFLLILFLPKVLPGIVTIFLEWLVGEVWGNFDKLQVVQSSIIVLTTNLNGLLSPTESWPSEG